MPPHGTETDEDDQDAESWVDSDWITIGDRRYKVTVVPSRTPDWVVRWCSDNLVLGIVGLFVMWKVSRKSRSLAARIYWQKTRWYNGKHHRLANEEFLINDEILTNNEILTERAANARAMEFVESLRAGVVPPSMG